MLAAHEETEDRGYWLRRAHAAADNAGLERDDRIELASMLLYRHIESWKELDVSDLRRIVDSLRGYHYVSVLRGQRGL